jgi:hypothetical protein
MPELLRRYLRLMRSHDFSYQYSDDYDFYLNENAKRIQLLLLKECLVLTPKGRWFVTKAEKRYGHV